jgi:hypothetical protein
MRIAGRRSFTVSTSDGEAARRWVRTPHPNGCRGPVALANQASVAPSRRWPSSARLAAAQDHLAVALRHGCAAPHPPRLLVARCCLCHHPALLPLDDLRPGRQALVRRCCPRRSIGPVPSGQSHRDVLAQATQAFTMRSSLPCARRALGNEARVGVDGPRPSLKLGTIASRPEPGRPRRPCPRCALRIGRQRSSTDNHGPCPCLSTCRISPY